MLDFYCVELKLCIELDGGQHGEDSVRRKDDIRTRHLESKGVEVIRFWNHEVLTAMECVADAISEQVHTLATIKSLHAQNTESE